MKGFDKSAPLEKRVDKLEMVLGRLVRRAPVNMTALITPYPISSAAFGDNVNGVVLRYMFPCEGVISKGMVHLGFRPKVPIKVLIRVVGDGSGTTREYTIENAYLIMEPGLKVSDGVRLEVSILNSDDEHPLNEVWLSFLWVPDVKDVSKRSFNIEEIEGDKLLEEN